MVNKLSSNKQKLLQLEELLKIKIPLDWKKIFRHYTLDKGINISKICKVLKTKQCQNITHFLKNGIQ